MEFEKYKKLQRLALLESIEFFSNKGKKERERWVVERFLDVMGVPHGLSDLRQLKNDPPDLKFRGVAFEITELMDSGRQRHSELKNRLKRLEKAKNYDDVMEIEDWDIEEISSEKLINKVEERLQQKKYSSSVKKELDVLVYVNLRGYYIDQNIVLSIPVKSPLQQWRSVSLLMNGGVACVLIAEENAPEFIQVYEAYCGDKARMKNARRVKIWNSFFKLAWTEAKRLYETANNTIVSKEFDPLGGTLNEEQHHILAILTLCNLSIEARANHLIEELVEDGIINRDTADAVTRLSPKDKWFLLPVLVGAVELPANEMPHQAIAQICAHRNNLMHVNYELIHKKFPSWKDTLKLFSNFIEAMEHMNVVLKRIPAVRQEVLDISKFD